MLALLWALIDELDLDRRLAKYYISMAFLSALLLAGIETAIAYIHGVWMSPYVSGFGLLWIIISALALWMRGGPELDALFAVAAASPNEKVKKAAVTLLDVIVGFYVVEGSVVLYFYLIPGTLNSVYALLVGIMGMYLSSKLKGRVFNWDWFFWPITVGVLITLFSSIAIGVGLMQQPQIPAEIGPWLRANLRLGTGELAYRLFILALMLVGVSLALGIFKRKSASKLIGGIAVGLVVITLVFWTFPEYQPEIKKLGAKHAQPPYARPAPVVEVIPGETVVATKTVFIPANTVVRTGLQMKEGQQADFFQETPRLVYVLGVNNDVTMQYRRWRLPWLQAGEIQFRGGPEPTTITINVLSS